MLGDKCHFAHGDAELRKPDDLMSNAQLNFALKSVQWHNCNQGSRGGRNQDRGGRGGMRGGFKNQNTNGNFRGNNGQMRGGFNNFNNRQGQQQKMGMQHDKMQKHMQNNANPSLNANYKTVMCRHFEQHGNCIYKDKCSYAHGEEELR